MTIKNAAILIASIAVIITGVKPANSQFAAQQTWCTGSCVGGTANAITLNIPNVTSFSDLVGVPLRFIPALANTSAMTVTVGGTAPTAIMKIGPNGLIPFVGREFTIGPPPVTETIIYDGTQFVWHSSNAPLVTITPSTPLVFYVSNSGSDSNNCLTSLTACATVQRPLAILQTQYTLNGASVTINIADGNYAPFITPVLNGSGRVAIVGDNATPANVIIAATSGEAIYVQGSGYTMSGMTVSSAAVGAAPHLSAGIRIEGAITTTIYDMAFGATQTADIEVGYGAALQMLGVASGTPSDFINIVGSSPAFMYVLTGASISTGTTSLTLLGTPAFSTAFAVVLSGGSISLPFNSITGTATGLKYSLSLNGTISTNGACSSYPGTGTNVTTGGQCL